MGITTQMPYQPEEGPGKDKMLKKNAKLTTLKEHFLVLLELLGKTSLQFTLNGSVKRFRDVQKARPHQGVEILSRGNDVKVSRVM